MAAPSTATVAPIAFEDVAARAVFIPIAYGSVSFWLGKRQPAHGEASHRWSVYVRHAEGKDLTFAVKKVVFTLHPTFPEPVREFTAPPFEVVENGWGEFEVGITIHLRDPAADPVRLVHKLKLYPTMPAVQSVDRPVVDEVYDEIVFNELPKAKAIVTPLLAGPPGPGPTYTFQEYMAPSFSAEEELMRVQAARMRVAEEVRHLEERLLIHQQEVARMKEEMRVLGVI